MPPVLRLNDNEIERVHVYKLLGLVTNNSLTWDDHVLSICTKTAKRLHFLKLLKRAAISTDDKLHYYKSVIRPFAEHACVVWHSSLTKNQSTRLESMQRALNLIYGHDNNETKTLPSPADRRKDLTKRF